MNHRIQCTFGIMKVVNILRQNNRVSTKNSRYCTNGDCTWEEIADINFGGRVECDGFLMLLWRQFDKQVLIKSNLTYVLWILCRHRERFTRSTRNNAKILDDNYMEISQYEKLRRMLMKLVHRYFIWNKHILTLKRGVYTAVSYQVFLEISK